MLDHRYEDLARRVEDLEHRLRDAIDEQPVVIETAGPSGKVVSGFRKNGGTVRRGVIIVESETGSIVLTNPVDGDDRAFGVDLVFTSDQPADVGDYGDAGSADRAARRDHQHRGVSTLRVYGGAHRRGEIVLKPGGNINITDDGEGTFTIDDIP